MPGSCEAVQSLFLSGACLVRVCVRVRFVSGFAVRVRVHVQFVSGSCPVRVWVSVRLHVWFANVSGSCLVRVRLLSVSCPGSCLGSCLGSCPGRVWVRIWFVSGSYLVRIWFGAGSGLDSYLINSYLVKFIISQTLLIMK